VENDVQQVNQVAQPLAGSVPPQNVTPASSAVTPKSKKPILFIVVAVFALILLVLLGGARYYVVSKLKTIKDASLLPVPVKESTESTSPTVDAASIDASIDNIQGDLDALDSDLNTETELNLDSSVLDINQ